MFMSNQLLQNIQKTSQKGSKTIRQGEEVGSNSILHSDTKKVKITKQNVKITKRARSLLFKGFKLLVMLKF